MGTSRRGKRQGETKAADPGSSVRSIRLDSDPNLERKREYVGAGPSTSAMPQETEASLGEEDAMDVETPNSSILGPPRKEGPHMETGHESDQEPQERSPKAVGSSQSSGGIRHQGSGQSPGGKAVSDSTQKLVGKGQQGGKTSSKSVRTTERRRDKPGRERMEVPKEPYKR